VTGSAWFGNFDHKRIEERLIYVSVTIYEYLGHFYNFN
jgi:hypothetical protein